MSNSQKIANIIDEAQFFKDEPPRPLRRQARAAEAYPIHALGEILAGAAEAIHERIQSPKAICAQSVLAAATLAVQAHADIELPIGQTRPLSAFFMTIATSGERKSSCDTEALRPVNAKEEVLRSDYQSEYFQWQNKNEAWECARSEILKKQKKDASPDFVASQLNALGERPQAPLIPMLTCPEPTYEGLCRYLMTGQPSVGVFSDEAAQFIGGHGMNEENRIKTAGAFCGLWDGKDVKRLRAGDGAVFLHGKRVSVHLMAQPTIANVMLSNRTLEDQGLLSRFLFSYPESAIGERFSKEISPSSELAMQVYERKMADILNQSLPMKESRLNELEPRMLTFDNNANVAWTRFSDEAERNMAKGGKWEQIRGFANKLPEQAARLAGIMTLFGNIHAQTVDKECLMRAILLASYYAGEALRLHEQGYVSPDIALAEKLLDWLHNKWPLEVVSLPDIYQRGLNAISDKKTALKVVEVLQDHGWLVPIKDGDFVNGVRRKQVWRIISVKGDE